MKAFPKPVRGALAQAFLGGWMSAQILHVPSPAVLADIGGAYSWAYSEERLQQFQIAEQVKVRGVTREVRSAEIDREFILDNLCFWSGRPILVKVRPHGNEYLPTRPVIGGSPRLIFAPTDLQGDSAWWWLHDVLAGVALGGAWPADIAQAIEFVAIGAKEGIVPARTPFGRLVDLHGRRISLRSTERRGRACRKTIRLRTGNARWPTV